MDVVINAVVSRATIFKNNFTGTFTNMTPEKYIRLVAVVGAYLLLRPYLLKLGARIQESQHEKIMDKTEMAVQKAAISPNSLRGQVEAVPDDSDEEEADNTTGANWGKKARKRQRQVLKKVLEAEEKLRQEQEEEESDKEIEQFLQENYGVTDLKDE